jgi:hypothetical protein
MTRITPALACALLVAAHGTALAQNDAVSFVPFETLARDIRSAQGTRVERARDYADFLRGDAQDLALYALGTKVYTALVEEGRIDKQLGASSAGPGSTSLVSRGSVPRLFGLAVESGALYQSVSGNTVTFRLNPSGLARAIATGSYLTSGPPLDPEILESGIDKASASASFDFQEGSSPGTFTGERSQLKEATVRYDVINKRDPRHPSHAAAIQTLAGDLSRFVMVVQRYYDVLRTLPGYDTWRTTTAQTLLSVNVQDDAALKVALVAIGDDFTRRFATNTDLQALANTMVAEIKSYRTIRDAAFASIEKSSVLTLEYAFNTLTVPAAALASLPAGVKVPDTSTARVVFASPLGSIGEATVNGSMTFFNSKIEGMDGSLRDVQVSGSIEVKLPELQSIGRPVLTFAGLGAFLKQQPFGVKVAIGAVETADGAIGVFQTKLTLPMGASGAQVPISFTLANRSEFNTEHEIRGSIGLTFDFDRLFVR